MASEEIRAARRAMLHEPHIAPLIAFCERLEKDGLGEVPRFDPLDGGVKARVLYLLEKPGPKTSPAGKAGSGFISRDNDDPSAAHSFEFHLQSGLPRSDSLLWNVIPWWDGQIAFTNAHRRLGIERLHEMLALLNRLDTIVLVGGTAHKAESALAGSGLRILKSWHPSMRVKNSFPDKFASIAEVWKEAARPGS
ncbi:uracil-DNA glycosylase [Ensifer aridi]|uniref:uracil-DNA glycosylase n=1 Tax=Ensifer aridi TaxID=1708715 RepID=UPI0015E3C943|nr:uracil-DNA glycosylase [Ensifer aridi]